MMEAVFLQDYSAASVLGLPRTQIMASSINISTASTHISLEAPEFQHPEPRCSLSQISGKHSLPSILGLGKKEAERGTFDFIAHGISASTKSYVAFRG